MSFVLFTHEEDRHRDAITIAARAWMDICQVEDFEEVTSGYDFCGFSDLPVLTYKYHVFGKESILEFLKMAFDINGHLNPMQ